MVNKDLLLKISNRLTELCEQYGVAANLEVKNYFDDECDVLIDKTLANERNEALCEICEELRKIDGIRDIYDRGANRVIKGDDYRQFEILVSEGNWTHTKLDDEAQELAMRKYFDKDFARKLAEEREKKRAECWEEYLLPLPEPDGNPNTELYLTMAYEPYDWIDKGYDEDGKHLFKRTEFRAYTEYYAKKLLSHPIKSVKFQRGYGGPGQGKPKQMRFEVKSITLWDPNAKIECDPKEPKKGIVPRFFAINLGRRL